MLILRSSSTFTVPKGVKKIDVFCVGGGGGAAFYSDDFAFGSKGGGGGGGYTSTKLGVDVNPGEQLSVIVGAGGALIGNSTNGSASSIGSICSAGGGTTGSYSQHGGAGGSGGGGGDFGLGSPTSFISAGLGGSDGSDGFGVGGGKGQGTTTRYFGESTGTLYSTGGAGYRVNGIKYSSKDANTGDGLNGESYNCYGGSGICIIRWGK